MKINTTQAEDADDINAVMPKCNLTKHCDNYLKTICCLWKYYWYIPEYGDITDFKSCKLKSKFANNTMKVLMMKK